MRFREATSAVWNGFCETLRVWTTPVLGVLQTFDISSTPADEQMIFGGVDISAIGSVAGTVTFRLFGFDYTAAGDFSGFGNDSGWLIGGTGINPVVDGNVFFPIPEPSTAFLTALGLLVLTSTRRR